MPCIRHPNPEDLQQKDKSPKHLALKTMRLTSRRPIGLQGAEILLLKGLSADSLTLDTGTKAAV